MVSINKIFVSLTVLASGISAASLFSNTQNEQSVIKTLPDEKPVPGDSPVAICDITEPQILDLQSVSISPNPPERGANLTIHAKGFLSKEVAEGAYVDVDVRYGYIKLVSQTFDLCEEIENVDLTCPLDKGKYDLVKTVELPDQVPPGKYVVYARAYTVADELITCITATVVFTVDSWKIFS